LEGVWARRASGKNWDPLLISSTFEASNFKFGTQLRIGTSLAKNNIWTKIGGSLDPGSIRKKSGTPYVFLQLLKLATSNLVHNLVLGLAYQKQRFGPKFAWVWDRGASKKNWDHLLVSATVDASNFKFVTELRFGTSLTKNNV